MTTEDVIPIPLRVKALLVVNFLTWFAVIGQITIIGKQVYDMTGRELDLGLLGLAEFAPLAVLAPLTGSLSDRLDRRKVLGVALVGEATASLLLFLYARSDPTSIGPIFAIDCCRHGHILSIIPKRSWPLAENSRRGTKTFHR